MMRLYNCITGKAIHCRSAANPGFHEAVAGLASLSSATSGHLRGVGLLKKDIDPVTNLNDLFHKGWKKDYIHI